MSTASGPAHRSTPPRWLWAGLVPLLASVCGQAGAAADDDTLWNEGLREAYFGERPVIQSDDVIELDAPGRADDPAVVPISITAQFPQSDDRYIRTIYLIVDRNPGALAGQFHFTPQSGRADLALRIRVNEYTPVRAIAETNDGTLYMSRRFVKGSGGCAAPIGTDLEAAMARMGKMKLRITGGATDADPTLVQLKVRHPNLNGLQMDQLTQLYTPAHFVRHVKVSFEGEEVFSAETSFAISENPSFRFYFVPQGAGELTAEVIDSKGLRFTHASAVSPDTGIRGIAQN